MFPIMFYKLFNAPFVFFSEAIAQRCFVKKVFLEISQNSQENTRAKVSFFDKVAGLRPAKKRLWHRSFPVNFVKFQRSPFFIEHLRWLLLNTKKNDEISEIFERNFRKCVLH